MKSISSNKQWLLLPQFASKRKNVLSVDNVISLNKKTEFHTPCSVVSASNNLLTENENCLITETEDFITLE